MKPALSGGKLAKLYHLGKSLKREPSFCVVMEGKAHELLLEWYSNLSQMETNMG